MKHIRKWLAVILIVSSLMVPISALGVVDAEGTLAAPGTVSPMAEEVEWCYRKYDGKWQKRLWSITYGRWLTDWIDCK